VRNVFSDSFIFIILNNKDYLSAIKAHNSGAFRIYSELNSKEILQEAEKAYNIYYVKLAQKSIEENKEEKIKEKYERMYWKENMIMRSDMSASVQLVRTLRNYFSQANIGALISMIKVVEESFPPEEDGSIRIDRDLAKEIFTSADVGAKVLESLNQYIHLAADNCKFQIHTISDFFRLLFECVNELAERSAERNIRFIMGTGLYLNSTSIMNLDMERLKVSIKELLINAVKFSKPGDKIYVIPLSTSKQIGFQVINTAYEYRKGVVGIPVEYQKKIFEPFFKMVEYSDTFLFQEEITSGLGLGLTLVKSIIEKHGGGLTITNILDHFEKPGTPIPKVMVEATFLREDPENI
jgi:signal transduction histidine kinase